MPVVFAYSDNTTSRPRLAALLDSPRSNSSCPAACLSVCFSVLLSVSISSTYLSVLSPASGPSTREHARSPPAACLTFDFLA
jgi:hypothetical protein